MTINFLETSALKIREGPYVRQFGQFQFVTLFMKVKGNGDDISAIFWNRQLLVQSHSESKVE